MKVCYVELGRSGSTYASLDMFPEAEVLTRRLIMADRDLGPTMLGEAIAGHELHSIIERQMWTFAISTCAGERSSDSPYGIHIRAAKQF